MIPARRLERHRAGQRLLLRDELDAVAERVVERRSRTDLREREPPTRPAAPPRTRAAEVALSARQRILVRTAERPTR